MGSTAKQHEGKFTYADYANWPNEERWEIINGVAYDMTPAPTLKHQTVLGNFHAELVNRFKGKPCKVFIAPTDVVFDDENIVQPDLLVVCDKDKMTQANIQGAPDLIIEVLSPSTSRKDKREKKALYERYGVREYLLVYPIDEMVERFSLDNDKYLQPEIINWDEMWESSIFPGLELPLCEIFEKERNS